jgi:hypothetical protein
MKSVFTVLFLTVMPIFLMAQFQHRCGYDHAVKHKDEMHPGFKEQADAIFRQAQLYAAQQRGGNSYIIPLAFHVVWKNPVENLPECKIIEQVDILNQAYQRRNADTSNLRAIFASVAGNPSIEFRLDTIIWHQTDSQFFSGGFLPDISFSDRVKHSASGGSDAINTTSHLNIWACNLGSSGILGYAYPPAGLSNWPANSQAPTLSDDGVVLDYRVVGASGTYVQQTTTINTKGNTAIHELGHYLGLRHIWGDGLLSILGIPDCNADDGVMDTPNCGIPSNYLCNPNQNTCGAGTTGDLPDMIENFMDYSEENCQNVFTLGQVAIMQGVLNTERSALANTPPLHGTVRPMNDALTRAVLVPINTDNSCTLNVNSYNTGASASMPACSGSNPANDVWFSFEALTSDLSINFSNIQATAGSSTAISYEVFSGNCGSLQSLGCYSSISTNVSGLIANETYYLRVYSADAAAAQSFNICLQSAAPSAVENSAAQLSEILVYPNPSSGLLNVKLPLTSDIEATLTIKNLLGQQIGHSMTIDNRSGDIQIDLNNLPNAVYLIDIIINDSIISKKIVLQR